MLKLCHYGTVAKCALRCSTLETFEADYWRGQQGGLDAGWENVCYCLAYGGVFNGGCGSTAAAACEHDSSRCGLGSKGGCRCFNTHQGTGKQVRLLGDGVDSDMQGAGCGDNGCAGGGGGGASTGAAVQLQAVLPVVRVSGLLFAHQGQRIHQHMQEYSINKQRVLLAAHRTCHGDSSSPQLR